MNAEAVIDIEDLAQKLRPGERIMALDLGTKTIGVALSDSSRTVASPLETVKRSKFTADALRLVQIATDNNVAGIVLGLPLNMDGSEGPRVQATRAFVRNMGKHTDLPFVLWDERLSTVAVERTLLEADSSRKRRAEVIDKMAASFILQGVLDRLANLS